MKIFGIGGAILAVVLVIVGLNSMFIVDQRQQALVLEFGASRYLHNAPDQESSGPGLKFKVPFIQNVVYFDRRNLGLDIARSRVFASDQETLFVDAFVRWRISDPLAFYQTVQNVVAGQETIRRFTETALRDAVAQRLPEEVISGDRAALMDEIRDTLRNSVKAGADGTGDLGIEIIDVRIRRADLDPDVAEQVYERMIASRRQQAEKRRAEGDEEAKLIRATARRDETVILANARRESEIIRGDGDAQRNKIYADAYTQDPEFFRFQRALIACEKAYVVSSDLEEEINLDSAEYSEYSEGERAELRRRLEATRQDEADSRRLRLVVSPDNLGLCDEFIRRAEINGRPGR